MTTTEERAYDWNEDPIENPGEGGGEFTLLPAGTYPFTVIKFERSRHEGSAKLPPCPKAIVTIEIDGGALGKKTRAENLFLHEKCKGLLAAFFKSIGHRKSGEPLVMHWQRVTLARGYCKVGVCEYDKKNGSGKAQANDVKAWLDPEEIGMTAPPTVAPAAPNTEEDAVLF